MDNRIWIRGRIPCRLKFRFGRPESRFAAPSQHGRRFAANTYADSRRSCNSNRQPASDYSDSNPEANAAAHAPTQPAADTV